MTEKKKQKQNPKETIVKQKAAKKKKKKTQTPFYHPGRLSSEFLINEIFLICNFLSKGISAGDHWRNLTSLQQACRIVASTDAGLATCVDPVAIHLVDKPRRRQARG